MSRTHLHALSANGERALVRSGTRHEMLLDLVDRMLGQVLVDLGHDLATHAVREVIAKLGQVLGGA